MDTIGTIKPVTILPVISASVTQAAAIPTLPAPATTADQISLSPQANQQDVVKPKVQIANTQVLGTDAVTMYTLNGQLYTRYRDEETGKYTYIPQESPTLEAPAAPQPALNITA